MGWEIGLIMIVVSCSLLGLFLFVTAPDKEPDGPCGIPYASEQYHFGNCPPDEELEIDVELEGETYHTLSPRDAGRHFGAMDVIEGLEYNSMDVPVGTDYSDTEFLDFQEGYAEGWEAQQNIDRFN